jgi:hypothetical protein
MENGLVEIVDIPIKNSGSFHSCLCVYQRVMDGNIALLLVDIDSTEHDITLTSTFSPLGSPGFPDWILRIPKNSQYIGSLGAPYNIVSPLPSGND